MNPSPLRDRASSERSAALAAALEQALRLGALMLRAGDTAFRVRESMRAVAGRMGVELTSVHLGLGGITASGRRDGESATRFRGVGPPGVNSERIGALESLARDAPDGSSAERTGRIQVPAFDTEARDAVGSL